MRFKLWQDSQSFLVVDGWRKFTFLDGPLVGKHLDFPFTLAIEDNCDPGCPWRYVIHQKHVYVEIGAHLALAPEDKQFKILNLAAAADYTDT